MTLASVGSGNKVRIDECNCNFDITECSHKGVTYADGETFEVDCNYFVCNNGIVACTNYTCNQGLISCFLVGLRREKTCPSGFPTKQVRHKPDCTATEDG